MRPENRQPSTPADAPSNPVPWWRTLFAGKPPWRLGIWVNLFALAVDLGIRDINWPRPITVVVVLLVILCWLAINGSVAKHVTLRVPMRPAWAKPVLVAAIVCVTVSVSILAIRQLWEVYPYWTGQTTSLDLLGLALVLLLVNVVAIVVRSR